MGSFTQYNNLKRRHIILFSLNVFFLDSSVRIFVVDDQTLDDETLYLVHWRAHTVKQQTVSHSPFPLPYDNGTSLYSRIHIGHYTQHTYNVFLTKQTKQLSKQHNRFCFFFSKCLISQIL